MLAVQDSFAQAVRAMRDAVPLARVSLPPALRVKVDILALLGEERQHGR